MEFHQLESLIALAQTCNFTRAAQTVHVVQSTLSQQIQSLERELGVKLFLRTTRKVELTPAGKKAVEYAKKLLQMRDGFAAELKGKPAEQTGLVSIGSEQVAANYDLVSLLESFCNEHPGIEVVFKEAISGRELDTMMRVKALDLCLINDIEGYPQLEGIPLYHDELVAVMNSEHLLAKKKKVGWRDLKSQELIIPSSNEMLEKKIILKCSTFGFEPRIAFRTSNLQITADLLKNPRYVSLNSQNAAKIRFSNALIRTMDEPIARQISLAYFSGKKLTPVSETFLEYAADYVNQRKREKEDELC